MTAEFAVEDIVPIDESLFSKLIEKAKDEPLRRYRYCLHKDHASLIQEMVIALAKDSYVQPHRHPEGRIESYSILEGEMDVLIFNQDGSLKKKYSMGKGEGKIQILRIGNEQWHQPVGVSDWVIYHEILQGPFNKDKVVEYAEWAETNV